MRASFPSLCLDVFSSMKVYGWKSEDDQKEFRSIYEAANQPGNKNGWSIEKDDGTDHPILATTGFAGPDQRYVVAAMYHVPHGGSMDRGTQAESDLIALVFGQPVPAKVSYPPPDD